MKILVILGLALASQTASADVQRQLLCASKGDAMIYGYERSQILATANIHSLRELTNLQVTVRKDKTQSASSKLVVAASKYTPKNKKYEKSLKFSVAGKTCKYNLLLPKTYTRKRTKFVSYVQQICGGKWVRTNTLGCFVKRVAKTPAKFVIPEHIKTEVMEYALGSVNTNEPVGSWDLRSPYEETNWEVLKTTANYISIGYDAMYGHEYDESEFWVSCDVELRKTARGWRVSDVACSL